MSWSFELYRCKAAQALRKRGFKGNAMEATADFDMSYEECKELSYIGMTKQIAKDADEYKRSCPEDFSDGDKAG